jgi:DNA-binding transcriptional ArsR family regulator
MVIPDPRSVRPDSQQLRVLAHPLRSRLLGALRHGGPATATALAARLGTNSGATSYHLRQLAEVGLVEDDPERTSGRDRWWRAAHGSTTWTTTDYERDPDAAAAVSWLLRRHANLAAGWLNDWLDEREQWSSEWQGVADQSDYHLHLTAAGLDALLTELHDVVARHRDAADPAAPGAEDVVVLLQAFPVQDLRL